MKLVFCICVAIAGLTASQLPQVGPVRDFSTSHIIDVSSGNTANAALADLDGDGDLDVVLAKGRHWEGADRILINDGHGTFTSANLGTAKDPSYSAIPADIDGDGDLDVLVSNDGEPGRVYRNDGKGHFTEAGTWGKPGWPTRNATIADLDGDRRPDIVAANRSPEAGRRSHFCLNDGTGDFDNCTELPVGRATTIVAADFDRDGDVDLAVPNRDGGESLLLYNDGKAGFTRTRSFGPDTMAARVAAAGDLDGDGWMDLVVGDERISSFIYFNDGKGALQSGLQLKFDSLPAPYSIAIADLNDDRRPDIVIGYARHRGSVLFNDGTGRSFRHVRFGDASDAVYGIALGDVDADGSLDIVAARNAAATVVFSSRPGSSRDVVVASDRIMSPVPSLQPARSEDWRLGIWRGAATHFYGQRWDVEVRLDSLVVGQVSGKVLDSSNGVAFCAATLQLLEHTPGETALFRATGCWSPSALARARWSNDGRIEWESWDEGGARNQRWKATLTRQR